MHERKWIPLIALFAGLLLLPAMAAAQTAGSVNGRVYDPSKAAIPGATITAVNVATGESRVVASDQSGYYIFPSLPVGTYDLTAEAQGFRKQVTRGLVVNVAAALVVDFNLSLGEMSQLIEVVSEAPVIETRSAATGGIMENRQLTELPINGRDYARFSLLIPGALARSNYIADLSFNGQHTVHNQFSIDGIDASRVDQPYMANGFERGARLLTGSLDTISEFRVQTNSYGAQYGRSAGSFVNIASKSGTNEFHGTAFDFFRNDLLDAKNFFAKSKPKFRFNDFGGNLGGPIRKDKTFFFVNYEGSRQRVGIVGTGTVPSAALRAQVLAKSPALKPILDNYPLGTSPTSNPLIDSYTTSAVSQIREDTGSIRIDNNFSSSNSMFVRVNVNDSHVFGPLFGVTASALGVNDFQNVPVRTSNVAISDNHIFSPRLINQVLVGMQRWGSRIISNPPIPQTSVTGLTVVPGDRGWTLSNNTSYQAGDHVSYVQGRHSIKFGGTVYRVFINRRSLTRTAMTYTSIDDFINNSIATASVTVGDPGHSTRATQVGLYVQDTFQVRPGLTLDYGLRWDGATPPHDAYDATQTFDTRTNTLAPPGTPYFKANWRDFAPRFAFAWSATQSLVVRGGFGVFYQAYPVGFGAYSVPLNNIPGNTTLVRQTIPDLSYPFDRFVSQGTRPLPTVAGFAWEKPDIYSNQWNLSVGYQMTESTGILVAYVGNHGLNLRRNMNINFFEPALGKRPIDGFADVNIETATGQNIYHGAQFSFIRRFARGISYNIQYTLAHAIDDVQDQGLYSAQPQDNRNWKAERGNSSGDIRHNLAFNVLYDLPFGQGRRFATSANKYVNHVIGGWQIAALGIIHTGIANTVYIGTNTYGNGNLTNQRPNWKGGAPLYPDKQTVDKFLNSEPYEMPAKGTFGNLGRNTINGPGFAQIDVSFLKVFKLGEGKNLQYRCEIFNLPNHPNFDQPNTTFGTANFGKIFNTFGRTIGIGTSRQIQMALKLNF